MKPGLVVVRSQVRRNLSCQTRLLPSYTARLHTSSKPSVGTDVLVGLHAKLCHAANGSRFETRPLLQFSAKKAPGNEIPVWPKSFQREVEFIGGLKKTPPRLGGKPRAGRTTLRPQNRSIIRP